MAQELQRIVDFLTERRCPARDCYRCWQVGRRARARGWAVAARGPRFHVCEACAADLVVEFGYHFIAAVP